MIGFFFVVVLAFGVMRLVKYGKENPQQGADMVKFFKAAFGR